MQILLAVLGLVVGVILFSYTAPSPKTPESQRAELMKKATEIESLLADGHRLAAIEVLREALTLDAPVPEFHYNLAVVCLHALSLLIPPIAWPGAD